MNDVTTAFHEFVTSRSESAFRRLYRSMNPRLYRFIYYRLAGDIAATQDAAQETWCRVVSSTARFGGKSEVSTWMIGIALNVCRETARESTRRASYDNQVAESHFNPDTASIVDLINGLDGLADGYREVLLLHDLVGLKHDEIAQLLGIDIGTSKSQLSRAKSRLVRYLDGGLKTTGGLS